MSARLLILTASTHAAPSAADPFSFVTVTMHDLINLIKKILASFFQWKIARMSLRMKRFARTTRAAARALAGPEIGPETENITRFIGYLTEAQLHSEPVSATPANLSVNVG
jgi:hypothetical protein